MSKKRSMMRKEQSERDRYKHLCTCSYYSQVAAFHLGLDSAQRQGMQGYFIRIPLELIDLTAAFIASMLDGEDILLFPYPSSESFRANVNFIQKTLLKAQISWSSLIACLWYLDRLPRKRRDQQRRRKSWSSKDLFIASIVVADKYLADITWTNADWVENTNYVYSLDRINQLERQLLQELDHRLFITEEEYRQFCHYLEFRLHLPHIMGDAIMLRSLTYKDIHVLSQALPAAYVGRLHLSLRPYEAIALLAKTVFSISVVYSAAMVIMVLAGYLMHQYAEYIREAARLLLTEHHLKEHCLTLVLNQVDFHMVPQKLAQLMNATAIESIKRYDRTPTSAYLFVDQ
ncbi:uncharacterized protein BYT42DRAFT_551372 [Radiomyces spectabilis]|uniref:uncharacterized protein n=1 Tax=Radiomyces spectabilis TaxID=64574 RepID=UPI00221E3D60|nr:uncharacterized protein BYT42DRAFT_551372 [Radiomyces spectabilis]KAI8393530.1 hypothetical protein BYT42DRAFT_551372 [Radiomyces spectabilis]